MIFFDVALVKVIKFRKNILTEVIEMSLHTDKFTSAAMTKGTLKLFNKLKTRNSFRILLVKTGTGSKFLAKTGKAVDGSLF